MGTPPYYFGHREIEGNFHRQPVCHLFGQFDVECRCGSHSIKLLAEADDEGLKVYLFCVSCRKREELKVR